MHPDRVEVMTENQVRPKLRVKRGFFRGGRKKVKVRRPPISREKILARNTAKIEKRYHVTPHLVSTLLLKNRGLINAVSRALKIPRQTLVRYIDKHEECLEALHTSRDAMGDVAEGKLFQAIEAGDVRCILYYLSTVHRQRGYGLRQEDVVNQSGGNGPVFVETVNIVGVPSGTYLPKEIAQRDNMVIENTG
jgi:hypothetical protein